MSPNHNLIGSDALMEIFGYSRPGDVERALLKEGIKPFVGKSGKFFITLQQLNAARGILPQDEKHDEELI